MQELPPLAVVVAVTVGIVVADEPKIKVPIDAYAVLLYEVGVPEQGSVIL